MWGCGGVGEWCGGVCCSELVELFCTSKKQLCGDRTPSEVSRTRSGRAALRFGLPEHRYGLAVPRSVLVEDRSGLA